MSRVTLRVAESESGPGVLSPGRLSVHGPTLLVTSVAEASSRLGFCPVHPCSAQTCPVPPRRALTAAESVSSSARWGRGARDPCPSQPPSSQAPGLASPGDSDVELEADSLPSVHPLCLFPLGCWVLFIGHILPDYKDPPSPRPLLGGDHVSLS